MTSIKPMGVLTSSNGLNSKLKQAAKKNQEIGKVIDYVWFAFQMKNPAISQAEKQEILYRRAADEALKNAMTDVKTKIKNLFSKK